MQSIYVGCTLHFLWYPKILETALMRINSYLFLHLVADWFCCQLWKDDVGFTSILRRRSSSIRCFSASISCSSFRRPCKRTKDGKSTESEVEHSSNIWFKTRSIKFIQVLWHGHGKCMHCIIVHCQAWASVSARRRSACNASSSRRLAWLSQMSGSW